MEVQKRLIPVNFTKGGNKKLGVVIHTMVGNLDGTDSFFKNPTSGVSAHYGVDLDGSRVYQWVDENDQAFAQGIVSNPTFKLVTERPNVNPNTFLISIECADALNPAGADRSKQLPVLIELVRDICKRNGIPIDREHVCGHREIRSTKTCPGNIDVDFVVREASKTQGVPMDERLKAFLQKFKFADINDADKVIEEHLGITRGDPDQPGGGYLAGERRNSRKWALTVGKYVADKSPDSAQFDDLQRFVAGTQSRVSALENNLKTQTEEMARRESEIANREEQVSRKQAQLLEQEKAKNSEISILSKQVQDERALREQAQATVNGKQTELDQVYKDKGKISNDLAIANAKIKNYESGIVDEDKKAVWSMLRQILERILGKKE